MSWFVDVAGKAEELLNRVDKTAAVALQVQQKEQLKEREKYERSQLSSQVQRVQQHYDSTQAPASNQNTNTNYINVPKTPPFKATPKPTPLNSNETSKSPVASNSNSNSKSMKDEESLLEFLNATVEIPSPKNPPKIKSNISPVSPKQEDKTDEHSSAVNTEKSADLDKTSTQVLSETNKTSNDEQSSKPEKKREEIKDREMPRPNSLLAAEVRELKAREVDYSAALEAKDSQLAILRVRLQEADMELKSTKETLKKYRDDNERLMKEHTAVSEVNNDAITKLQQKLQETEIALKEESELREKAMTESRVNFSKLEEEKQQHALNLASTQKNLIELKAQVKDLSQQLRQSKSALDTVKQDLAYYRQKAQRLLQSKEKLISTLKDNNVNNDDQSELDSSQRVALEESLTKENDTLREDLIQSKADCESLRVELQVLEQSCQEEIERANEKCRNLEESLQVEKRCREDLENEIIQHKEELKYLREDLTRTKTNLTQRIKDRDLEVEKLRKQLTTKAQNGSNQSELESRIRNLTESLIQKQMVLEALSTEKNSLVMQLERLEQRMKEAQLSSNKGNISVGISVEDTSKNRAYFTENAFDGRLTKRVKKAYGIIDSLSIRTGSFLRRNPASRAFLLAYMFLLHIWVLIILLSYQPEIHTNYDTHL